MRNEFRRVGRQADADAVRALLDAIGGDLRELASAVDQLASDTTGRINAATVARYYRGRAEATGFSVADHAVEGRLNEALEQLRWALATGTAPVLITSALATGVRLLGRVGAAPRTANPNALAAEVGAPPWKIDRVRQQLRGWHPDGVAARPAGGRGGRRPGQGRRRQPRVRPGARHPPDRRLPRLPPADARRRCQAPTARRDRAGHANAPERSRRPARAEATEP